MKCINDEDEDANADVDVCYIGVGPVGTCKFRSKRILFDEQKLDIKTWSQNLL